MWVVQNVFGVSLETSMLLSYTPATLYRDDYDDTQASLCFSPWPFLTAVWHRVCFNGSDDFLSRTPHALQQRQKK